jgi:hypothetical protein
VIGNVGMIAAALLAASALVVRYRRGDGVERAQIRWLALSGSFVAAAFAIASFQISPISDRAWELGFLFLSLMPIAIGVAVTRYRLYEIDRLINRTLVYGSLTAILAGIFTAGIGFAQRLFIATTGETSDAAIVLTTLVVATLYAPLRKRLEAVIDRRFKYEHLQFGAYRDELTRVLDVLDPLEPRTTRSRGRPRAPGDRRCAWSTARPGRRDGGIMAGRGRRSDADRPARDAQGRPRRPRVDGRPHDPLTVAQLEDMAVLVASALDLARQPTPETRG